MKDTLVEFRTSKLANEIGFDIISKDNFYHLKGEYQMQYGSGKYWMDEEGLEWQPEVIDSTHKGIGKRTIMNTYSRPTQSLLQKWLREVHNIRVFVIPTGFNEKYDFRIYYVREELNEYIIHLYDPIFSPTDNYEEALEEGLYQALLLLKNKLKKI
jgi:hypothetical protein